MEYWCINNSTAEWNRMKSPEIDPNIHENLVYDNGGWHLRSLGQDLFFKMVPEQPHSHFRKR